MLPTNKGHNILPITTKDFAERAYAFTMNPNRNPLKEMLDSALSFEKTPPLLGIFNDIPWHKIRESEVHAWASAGFSWVVNDAEHSQWEGHYGREQNAILARLGLLPVQRLEREAISRHGDAFQLGARATMRPYATSFKDIERYLKSIRFPVHGAATPDDRGGYPVRGGDRRMMFTPDELRGAETETQGWVQFETAEFILDLNLRDKILDLMADQGKHRTCGFVGPFDAIMREGDIAEMDTTVNSLFRAAADRGVHIGRVIGSGAMENPQDIENAMVVAIENGARLICVHPVTSDLTLRGATAVAAPFHNAARRCGF